MFYCAWEVGVLRQILVKHVLARSHPSLSPLFTLSPPPPPPLSSVYTVFSVISVIVLFSYVVTQTKIRNTKCKRMRIRKGSPRTKITLHENLKFE